MGNKQKTIIQQLITTATSLLIQDALEAIHYAHTVFDFIMLV